MLQLSAGASNSALRDAQCCSMRAGEPPTFKRIAPSSSVAGPQMAPGGQKAARRGAASSATQGRSSSAAAGAFLPPQLKGRSAVHIQPWPLATDNECMVIPLQLDGQMYTDVAWTVPQWSIRGCCNEDMLFAKPQVACMLCPSNDTVFCCCSVSASPVRGTCSHIIPSPHAD